MVRWSPPFVVATDSNVTRERQLHGDHERASREDRANVLLSNCFLFAARWQKIEQI